LASELEVQHFVGAFRAGRQVCPPIDEAHDSLAGIRKISGRSSPEDTLDSARQKTAISHCRYRVATYPSRLESHFEDTEYPMEATVNGPLRQAQTPAENGNPKTLTEPKLENLPIFPRELRQDARERLANPVARIIDLFLP